MSIPIRLFAVILVLSVLLCLVRAQNVSATLSWTDPANLADNISPDGYAATDPHVAIDGSGNAVIVWVQSDGSYVRIYKCEYRNGSWSSATVMSNSNNYDASSPHVAMDGNGNAIITWAQFYGFADQIYYCMYRDGAWTSPALISSNFSYAASSPQVAMNDNGSAIITWVQPESSYDRIYKSVYSNGAWSTPAVISSNISSYNASSPRLAMDDNGNAIITWVENDGSNNQIFKSDYRGGIWSAYDTISDNVSQPASDPQVAMDNNGNAIITWVQSDGSDDQIFMSEYRSNAWVNPAGSSDNISPDNYAASSPHVAMADNNTAIITWSEDTASSEQIFISEYRNGSWVHPAISGYISPSGGGDAQLPRVAMDVNGNAVVTWVQADASSHDHVYRSEYRGGSWTNPILSAYINPSVSGSENPAYPQVAMDDSGNAIITWYQKDGSSTNQIFKSQAATAFVTTTAATSVTGSSATLGGNVTSSGTTSVTERGVCYGTSQNPTTSDSKAAMGAGLGTFSGTIASLQTATAYYVRAYAVNANGTAYGSQVGFTTSTGGGDAGSAPGLSSWGVITLGLLLAVLAFWKRRRPFERQ